MLAVSSFSPKWPDFKIQMSTKEDGPVWRTFLQQMGWQIERQIGRHIRQVNTLTHMWGTQIDRQTAFSEMHLCCNFTWTTKNCLKPKWRLCAGWLQSEIKSKMIYFSSVNKGRCYYDGKNRAYKPKKTLDVKKCWCLSIQVNFNQIRGKSNPQQADIDINSSFFF